MPSRSKPSLPIELSVGDVARRAGVPVSTLHFYEAEGLIRSWRNAGNQRRYPRGILRRVAIIKVAQRAGVPLREIAGALACLPQDRPLSAQDWSRMSSKWKEDLESRIARLSALRDQLSDCIGCGCLSLKLCPLRNPLDRLGAQGSGPRLLPSEIEDGD
jgi:MerR family redox-sensitive transcriptional activator SoxR